MLALICSRATQHIDPEPSIPALFVFDRAPIEDVVLLQRVVRAAPEAGERRTDARKGQGGQAGC
eukprot:2141682-Pyramimonas_sp.AAC.1